MRTPGGIVAILQGAYLIAGGSGSLSGGGAPTVWPWITGLLAVAVGISLLIGFLTPVTGPLLGLGAVGAAFLSLPESTPNLLDGKLSTALVVTINSALVLLGPGAFSLDARLFGRREIIIPHSPRSPRL